VKYGPVFPSIHAGHRTSRMNTDPSAHEGSVSCSALTLNLLFPRESRTLKISRYYTNDGIVI
jgi:hypothetical protein